MISSSGWLNTKKSKRSIEKVLFFEQIFDGAAENFGDTVKRFDACFIDVFVPLFIHLDGAETDAGAFCKLGLGAPVDCADAFQIRILKVIPNLFIRDNSEFGYIGFM